MAKGNGKVEENKKFFSLRSVYSADISFERNEQLTTLNIGSQQAMQPQLDVSFDFSHIEAKDHHYVLNLRAKIDAKVEEGSLFITEVVHSGLFMIQGFNEEEMQYILNVSAPQVIFPYLRTVVSNLITQGGFPPYYLEPIDFNAMFMKKQQEKNSQ